MFAADHPELAIAPPQQPQGTCSCWRAVLSSYFPCLRAVICLPFSPPWYPGMQPVRSPMHMAGRAQSARRITTDQVLPIEAERKRKTERREKKRIQSSCRSNDYKTSPPPPQLFPSRCSRQLAHSSARPRHTFDPPTRRRLRQAGPHYAHQDAQQQVRPSPTPSALPVLTRFGQRAGPGRGYCPGGHTVVKLDLGLFLPGTVL